MDPALQRQLADLLAKLTASAESAATWTVSQATPLVHEKIVLGRVETTVVELLLALALFAVYRAVRYCQQRHWDFDGDEPGVIIGLIMGAALAAGGFIGNGNDLLMAWFAPRLYIVEWLRSLVKS